MCTQNVNLPISTGYWQQNIQSVYILKTKSTRAFTKLRSLLGSLCRRLMTGFGHGHGRLGHVQGPIHFVCKSLTCKHGLSLAFTATGHFSVKWQTIIPHVVSLSFYVSHVLFGCPFPMYQSDTHDVLCDTTK